MSSCRVDRGCCWFLDASSARSTNRDGYGPGARNDNLGFRLARPSSPVHACR